MPKRVGLSGKPLRMIRAGEALQIRHRDENPRTDATEGELLLGQKVVYGSAADLHRALLHRMKDFLLELGRDFCFIGSEFPVQVGTRDFALDLLFFHRGLNCLVAFELKVQRFEPEHLGKLTFYLEALDRDVRKPHEQPSIGVLLCASKEDKVVEYALSRTLSPALIAEYQTALPDKKLLQAKLQEFYMQDTRGGEAE